ncbi:MAG: LysE family transporter [Pseudomonadota bacterium]
MEIAAPALITLAGMQLAIAASPGPATVMTIRTSAKQGLRAGLIFAFGLSIAIVIWASAALAGLSLVFQVAPWLQTALRVMGGLFLIWIGIQIFRHAHAPLVAPGEVANQSGMALFRLGVFTNLANPKALAYFAAVFTGILPVNPTLLDAALILAIVFSVELVWYALVALVFAQPSARRAYARAKGWVDRLFGTIVAGLGARIAAG